MYFVISGSHGKCFSAIGRDQIQLSDLLAFIVTGLRILAATGLALRKKCYPLSVRRPLRRAVVAGLRQLDQAAAVSVNAIQPQFRPKNLLIPVSLLRVEQHRVAIGRNFQRAETHRVEEFIDSELRLCGLPEEKN